MDRFTDRTVIWQAIIWPLYAALWYYIFQIDAENEPQMLRYMVGSFILGQIFQANFTNYWVIPRYFYRKKYGWFIIWILLISTGSAQLAYLAVSTLPGSLDQYSATYNDWIDFFAPVTVISLFLNAVIFALRLTYDRLKNERIAEQLKQEKLAAELKFLKAQINPHFLFNSINTIFHLIDLDPAKSKSVLSRFSDVLRYHLYQSEDEMVSLSTELTHVNNYVEMEKLRRGDILDVKLSVQEDLSYIEMAPLVLLSFVENAYKHVSTSLDKRNWIDISISQDSPEWLSLQVENSIDQNHATVQQPKKEGGIGLANIRKRLELIYGSNHSLKITENDERFKVLLKIKIK